MADEQQVTTQIKGLYTSANDFSGVPPGALDVADDIVIDHDNLAEPRRGYTQQTGTFGISSDRINRITNYQGFQIYSYTGGKLTYYSGGSYNDYSGTYSDPDSVLAKLRFVEAQRNLYFSTSTGVKKLDVYSGTPIAAGVPKGLDLQLALTGSSGFLTENQVVTISATVTSGSANLSLISSTTGISTGMYVEGTGIPDSTTVSSITQSATVLITTGSTTAGSADITSVNPETGLAVGQLVSGVGIPTGSRITVVHPGAVANKYTLSNNATTTATGTTLTFSSDPVITMSANGSATNAGVSVTFSNGSEVGYRLLWGIKDANNNILRGSPTQFASVTNTLGRTTNVQVTSSVPSGITTSHFYEIYRSSATATASITPLDDEQLVYSANVTPTDISNGYVQITDSTPDSLRGAYLYTGISQQGILQANDPPPFCKDFCTFRDLGIYGNIKSKQRLKITLLAASGLANDDTIVISGVTYTAKASETIASGQFQLYTTGTASQNIRDTVNSLIRVINRYATNTFVYAYLLSGPTDLPGQMVIEEKGTGGSTFYATVSAHGSAWSPTLPTSGTTIASTQDTFKNGILISKSGQFEACPSGNVIFAGSASQEILRVIPLREYVVILKQDGIYRITGTSFQTVVLTPFDLTTKLLSSDSAVSLSNEVWGFFDQGVCSVSDTGVNVRSRAIETTLKTLIGTSLSAIKQYSFGVGYETDRKYILALPSASGDTQAKQEYVFHSFTNAWTRWTRAATTGFIDTTVDLLYLGNGSANTVSYENKSGTYTDYIDEGFSDTITAVSGTSITLSSVSAVNVGDLLWQSTNLFSVITAINRITNVATVNDSIGFTAAACTIYPAINSVVQWKPMVAGNPAFVRQYTEGVVLFKRSGWALATISTYSDVSAAFVDTTLDGTNTGAWGLFAWGTGSLWGGINRPKGFRFLVPQDQQMSSQLSCKLTVRNAYANWAAEGIAISVIGVSKEVGI